MIRLNLREVCDEFRIGDKRAKRLLTKVPFEVGPNRSKLYALKDVIDAILSENTDVETLAKERARLAKVQRKIAEIELKQLEGEYFPLSKMIAAHQRELGTLRSHFLSLGFRLASEIDLGDRQKQMQIKLHCDEVMNQLLDDFQKQMTAEIEALEEQVTKQKRGVNNDEADTDEMD
jgi:hypothetical protein